MIERKWNGEFRMRAVHAVLDRLKEYNGEVIFAGEHVLHAAVVALELTVDHPARRKQPRLLLAPAVQYWFQGLWASRNNARNVPPGTDKTFWATRDAAVANPDLACYWMSKLNDELRAWLSKEPIRWEARLKGIDRVTKETT